MLQMVQMINRFRSEKGQGIVEYALILAFVVAIAVVALGTDGNLAEAIQQRFTDVVNALTGNTGNAGNAGNG